MQDKRHQYFSLYDIEESLIEREALALFRAETSIENLYQNHSPDVFHAIVSRYNEKYDD